MEKVTGITVTFNKAEGGIELRIPYGISLNAAERQELRDLKFKWSKGKHLWWNYYSQELVDAIKNSKFDFLKSAAMKNPTAAAVKELEANAERKIKASQEKAAAKAASKVSTNDVLMAILARLEAQDAKIEQLSK